MHNSAELEVAEDGGRHQWNSVKKKSVSSSFRKYSGVIMQLDASKATPTKSAQNTPRMTKLRSPSSCCAVVPSVHSHPCSCSGGPLLRNTVLGMLQGWVGSVAVWSPWKVTLPIRKQDDAVSEQKALMSQSATRVKG